MTAVVDEYSRLPEPPPHRILLVLDARYPPPRGGGGAEHQVEKLARRFMQLGYAVEVWVPAGENANNPTPIQPWHGTVRHVPHPRVRWIGGLVMQLNLLRMLWRHRRVFSAIHTHIVGGLALSCCLMGPWLRVPVIVKFTGYADIEKRQGRSGIVERMRRRLLQRATFIQAISRRIHSTLCTAGFATAAVKHVPNGVELAAHAPDARQRELVRRELAVPADATVAVYSGRIEQVKGIDDLLDAWDLVCATRPGCHLVLVGAALEETIAEIRQRCEGRATLPRIHFLGLRTDVARILHMADFAVLPSHAEGLSNALLEFMATGLPIVATRVSGTEDMVRDGHEGFLCEPRDVEGLANALRRMLALTAEDRAAMGRRALDTVGRECSVETVAGRLLALYGIPSRDNWTGGSVTCAE
jgi:glycosyltransferase involved in cell wall biosynthesis